MESHLSPWKLGGLSVRELAGRVWSETSEDEVTDRAAALSYYFLFSLFPALLFLTALLGFLPIPHLWDRLMGYVQQVLPGDSAALIQRTLGEILATQRSSLLSIGALTALWAASNGMASVMSALNVAYDLSESRPWWKRRLLAIGLTVGFSILLLGALVLLVFGGIIGGAAAGWLGLGQAFTVAWNAASVAIAVLCVLVGIALVYYLAPNGEQRWQWVTPGSAVALVLWLAMSFALRLYVSYFGNYNATYGSIGGVILLMLWLYLTGVVLLFGAEVNAEIEHAAALRGEATAKAPGEHVAPADRDVAEPATDAALAARFIARQTDALRREDWLAAVAVAAAAALGWLMAKRPVGEVARQVPKAVRTGRQVTAALAASERFRSARQTRGQGERESDEAA